MWWMKDELHCAGGCKNVLLQRHYIVSVHEFIKISLLMALTPSFERVKNNSGAHTSQHCLHICLEGTQWQPVQFSCRKEANNFLFFNLLHFLCGGKQEMSMPMIDGWSADYL